MIRVKNAPPWWGKFLAAVRRHGGVLSRARDELGLSPNAHHTWVNRSKTLADELDEAVREGKQQADQAKAERILARYAEGKTLSQAAAEEDMSVNRVYVLLEKTGLREKYENLRDTVKAQQIDYRPAVVYLRKQIDLDTGQAEDVTTLAYIAAMKRILDVVDRDSRALREIGVNAMRNTILREIGTVFGDEDDEDFPPFLARREEDKE